PRFLEKTYGSTVNEMPSTRAIQRLKRVTMSHQLGLTVVALALLLPWRAHGLGVRIADQDPFATARGNAFAATADNPSAIYYNPAGITQLHGQNANFSLYPIYLNSHYTSPAGSEVDTKDEIQAIPRLYYTYSFQHLPLSLGLGIYTPYGLGLDWPDNSRFRTLA